MQKITSFTIDHIRLQTGLFVSRVDSVGNEKITTLDIRMTRPNAEPVMDTAAAHAFEHLGATWLRNNPQWQDKIIYFGPMGCRTGFYLVMFGKLNASDILPLVRDAFAFIESFEGDIPGASAVECGNYQEQNLNMAHYYARKYLKALEQPSLIYPD